jgi:hypothetical protein
MTKYEGDGCVPEDCTPAGEEDNGCQIWYLDPAVGCLSAVRPARYRCDDGKHLTGGINHALDPDEVWLYPDMCDSGGSCIGGTDLTDTALLPDRGDACPWKTACNIATIHPEGCTYEADPANGKCGIDDMACDGSCPDTHCAECNLSALATDINNNKVPDAWEEQDFDHDCDGTADAPQIGEGAVQAATAGTTPLYVFVAYMDMGLNVDLDTGVLLHPGSVHTHELDPVLLQDVEQAFSNQGVQLVGWCFRATATATRTSSRATTPRRNSSPTSSATCWACSTAVTATKTTRRRTTRAS